MEYGQIICHMMLGRSDYQLNSDNILSLFDIASYLWLFAGTEQCNRHCVISNVQPKAILDSLVNLILILLHSGWVI